MKLLKTLDKKELLTRVLVGILAIGMLAGAYFYATDGRRGNEITINSGYEFETARVLEVTEEHFEGNEEYENEHASGYQILELELLSGRYAGDQVTVKNVFSVLAKYSIYAEPGMAISNVNVNDWYLQPQALTPADGVISEYPDAVLWTAVDNGDGTWSFTDGGSEEWLEKIDCPRCGAIVWYSERGRYAYECDCGWFSGRT